MCNTCGMDGQAGVGGNSAQLQGCWRTWGKSQCRAICFHRSLAAPMWSTSMGGAKSVETPRDEMTSGADPNLSGSTSACASVDLPFTMDDDPADRRWDRLLAYLGLLDDAAPMFRDGDAVPHGNCSAWRNTNLFRFRSPISNRGHHSMLDLTQSIFRLPDDVKRLPRST